MDAILQGYQESNTWREVLKDPSKFPKFTVRDGMITKSDDRGNDLLIIPKGMLQKKSIRGTLLEHTHEVIGHLGARKTLDYTRQYYWWNSITGDTEKFCKVCRQCQTTKRSTRCPPGLLHSLPIPENPWSSISMDFTGPFPTSMGQNYLWVVLCRLTSNVHLIPLRTTMDTLELAYLFMREIVCLHGVPQSIVSDRDSKFTSKFWHELH